MPFYLKYNFYNSAQVNIGALAGGLGGLYWINSVSKDLAHLRETPLGEKLDIWYIKKHFKKTGDIIILLICLVCHLLGGRSMEGKTHNTFLNIFVS